MIRTRFAPSPTGYMHIGNLRTALYGYLIAKSNNGKFILRIEDTDSNRFVENSDKIILYTLKQTNLQYDEGPGIGGPFYPYIQSQRKDIYLKYALDLVETKQAYYCFCNKERLNELKRQNIPYDRKCLSLTSTEVQKRINNAEPFVIRQLIPTGKSVFVDQVYGKIEISNNELDDQVLIKSDGYPTYNFANVVDDHLMQITHVVRGCEYLSSTPKYNLLYLAFGWEQPTYVHLPLILNENGKKLSKRNNDATFQKLIEKGFLADAIVNYIALLGWNPKSNKEIFSLDELIKEFNIKDINKSPAIFDLSKLKWMNSKYIKSIDADVFYDLAKSYIKKIILFRPENKKINLSKIFELTQTRIDCLTDIPNLWCFIDHLPTYKSNIFINNKFGITENKAYINLKLCFDLLSDIKNDDWIEQYLKDNLIVLTKKNEIKSAEIFWPLLISLAGQTSAPCGATYIAEILGKQETLSRIKTAMLILKPS